MKHNDKMENLKEWEDTTKNQEFTYPMWFKDRLNGHIVEFTEDRVGTVVYSPTGSLYKIGYYSENWASYINDEDYYWQQVENPNKELDKIDDDLISEMEEYEHQKPIQYQIGIDTFQRAKANLTKDELIACIKFNIDKYNWRKKGQDIEDFKKIIDYANFAIEVLEGEK